MSSYMLILYFNGEIRTLNSPEARELHGTYSEFLVNLMWATVGLQIVSTFAIKAALSDLRNAIEAWLTKGPASANAEVVPQSVPAFLSADARTHRAEGTSSA